MKSFRSPHSMAATIVVALLVLSSSMISCWATTTTNTKTVSCNTSYISSSCSCTKYPKLCYSSLSPYACTVGTNLTQLAIVALDVSLSSTQNTSALVNQLSNTNGLMINETNSIKDCVYEIGDAISELKLSIEEMKVLGGSDYDSKLSNIETLVRAASMDDNTCLQGLDGYGNGKLEKSIRNCVKNTSKLTSNAFAIAAGLYHDKKSKYRHPPPPSPESQSSLLIN